MKKLIWFTVIVGAILLSGTAALAGDVPEGLLYHDGALLFFGEVMSYNKTDAVITVIPLQKIKGDVRIGTESSYTLCVPVGDPEFSPAEGERYLMAYYDEINPLYVFRTTGADIKTLRIEGIERGSMWERIQIYLNDGSYEQQEAERIKQAAERLARINASASSPDPTPMLESTPTPASSPEASDIPRENVTDFWMFGLIGAVAIAGAVTIVVYVRKRKQTEN